MARGVYTVEFGETSFTNALGDYDFFEFTPADDRPIELVALFIGNKTEVGDSEEEMVSWKVIRGHTTTGNGTTTTPQPLDPRDAAAGFTAETVASTPATAGTPVDLHTDTFNIRTGLQIIWPPDMRPKSDQAQTLLVVRMTSTLADDATLAGTAYVREL